MLVRSFAIANTIPRAGTLARTNAREQERGNVRSRGTSLRLRMGGLLLSFKFLNFQIDFMALCSTLDDHLLVQIFRQTSRDIFHRPLSILLVQFPDG